MSVLTAEEVFADNSKLRIDASYFSRDAIAAEKTVLELPNKTLDEICAVFRKGIFDIKAETYVEPGEGVPFIRIGDLSGPLVDKTDTAWISTEAHATEAKTALRRGDLILSKTAYPAASLVTLEECNVSQDTIAVRLSAEGSALFKTGYVAAFLNTKYGYGLLKRRFQGNVQEHLSLDDGKAVRIPVLSRGLQERVEDLLLCADDALNEVAGSQGRSEEVLLSSLGLAGWVPDQPLTYTANSDEVFSSDRMDAQYFRPMFEEIERRLRATGNAVELSSILSVNARGRQPEYASTGLRVINSKHVRVNRVSLKGTRAAAVGGAAIAIRTGDVLVNGTGVGTIGRAAPYLHEETALPDNHVTVLRTGRLDPIYLSAFLNSHVGQWQIERQIKGSSGQTELYPAEIGKVLVWDAPSRVQDEIRTAVLSAFSEEHRASRFAQLAIRVVETAIEAGEPAANELLAKDSR